MKILVGEGSCGIAAGAGKVYSAIEDILAKQGGAELGIVGCLGMCWLEPIVDVYDGAKLVARLVKVGADRAQDVVDFATGVSDKVADLRITADDQGFLSHQTRIALRNCGLIDPENIDEYIAVRGYEALKKALTMTPEQVIEVIKVSGLAGRGGAGFPTWFKWNAARQSAGEEKYLICNADEGDPGAFMDRAVIESDPHSLIEGTQ